MKQLKERDGSVLIFVKTKFGAERLAAKLNTENPRRFATSQTRKGYRQFSQDEKPYSGGNGYCRPRAGHSAY